MVKIKICGLKETEHALLAVELGADLLGFVFADSPRRISKEKAREIAREIPGYISKVGVFVNEDSEVINDIVNYCGLDMVQLHGDETPEQCSKILCPTIKGFRIKNFESLDQLAHYKGYVDIFLLDSYVKGVRGGTGKTFDWSLAGKASKYGNILLAGGLTPDNVGIALQEANPFGVDVSSGVETDGRKDPAKIEAFIKQVRGSNNVCITR